MAAIDRTWTPYCGAAPDPSEWLGRWNLDPVLLVLLALAAVGVWRIADPRRRAAALAAVAVLALIFVSPLCALSSALFAARTLHHILLVAVAAPALAWALPRAPGSGVLSFALLQAAVFWTWHAPAAYGWALSSDGAYWLMQVSLLGTAVGFWAAAFRAPWLAAVAGLLLASVLMGLLGALLTFAPTPFYAPHLASAELWGLGALRDQQAAGLLMWAPAAGLYLAAALGLMGRRLDPGAAMAGR